MGFRKIAFLILIATLTCASEVLARDGHRGNFKSGLGGVAGTNRPPKNQIFIVRRPLPIGQAPPSTGSANFGASSSSINSRIDSRF
jgi:hypothetical protein